MALVDRLGPQARQVLSVLRVQVGVQENADLQALREQQELQAQLVRLVLMARQS